ncbi:DMT family transporter [Chroococcus sp. FPU101]|uniref:DMT family transporter n=1 Tax=Chroococcus sp. FPU101 TaxID=1974212 RepID=UPI001A8D9630|nr:DMT family transporter [Chroococcus sp. FPU101]GFE69949.1 hypothetical protein CFPU101_25590 [Chroococcus sp. FPU101]
MSKISRILNRIPNQVYLWIAVLIFASSNSVTRKIIDLGAHHFVNGRNPISLCNVLFVGNICAFLLMILIFYPDWQPSKLKNLTRQDWIILTVVGILSGAIAPALIFTALAQTNVTNVVLIGRLEPLITLALSVWLLKTRVNSWTVSGSLVSFVGVAVTVWHGLHIGKGELLIAIAAAILAVATVISKSRLQSISIGIFSVYRTAVGTIVFFILANILYGSHHFAQAFSPYLWAWMILYAAVIVVIGQLCWFAGLRNANSAQTNLASSINPLAAIVMAYLILGEVPTSAQYLGGSIIIVGVVLSAVANFNLTVAPLKMNPAQMMMMAVGFRGI